MPVPWPRRRVVKVGGSLLTLPTLVAELRRWISLQSPAATYFIPGGGTLADAIAEQQRELRFDDVAAHWLCIRAMRVHYEMLSALMPECRRTETFDDVSCAPTKSGEASWLDPWALMQHDLATATKTLSVDPLPADWTVSSDSIAARTAMLLGADELVLMKSALASESSKNYVDDFFATAAQSIRRVRFVNLRDPQFAEQDYRP